MDYDFPIKILDNLIESEEQIYGFSLFNRGIELKKSLIDTTKVKTFIEQYQTGGDLLTSRFPPGKQDVNQKAATKQEAKKVEKEDWNEIMNYFKENPKALLDAIPTPRGEEERTLKEFKAGQMRFNDTSTSGFGANGYKGKLSSAFGLYSETP